MSTLADCPSQRCPGCHLSSMALSQGDDLAVITATSNSLCAWERAVETEGAAPTLAPHCSSQREFFFSVLRTKNIQFCEELSSIDLVLMMKNFYYQHC